MVVLTPAIPITYFQGKAHEPRFSGEILSRDGGKPAVSESEDPYSRHQRGVPSFGRWLPTEPVRSAGRVPSATHDGILPHHYHDQHELRSLVHQL